MGTFPRTCCCVPGCRRFSTRFPHEWICGEHWRLIDRALKRLRTKLLKRAMTAYLTHEARWQVAMHRAVWGGPRADVWYEYNRLVCAHNRWQGVARSTWAKMRRQAIERAAGI